MGDIYDQPAGHFHDNDNGTMRTCANPACPEHVAVEIRAMERKLRSLLCEPEFAAEYAAMGEELALQWGAYEQGDLLRLLPGTTCEGCQRLLDPDRHGRLGYTRCEPCDPEGDHTTTDFPRGNSGDCVGCWPIEKAAEFLTNTATEGWTPLEMALIAEQLAALTAGSSR